MGIHNEGTEDTEGRRGVERSGEEWRRRVLTVLTPSLSPCEERGATRPEVVSRTATRAIAAGAACGKGSRIGDASGQGWAERCLRALAVNGAGNVAAGEWKS
jgi:hypothetical protein